jgi:adenosylcobinamide-GDP ribazoletransferase
VRDAWRLSVGTLTAIPVPPPADIARATSGTAMLLAPLAVLPLGVLVGLSTWAGHAAQVPPLALGFVTVGLLALGSRALHWDGLADTVDGLAASYDRTRALQVMRSGTAGPAGVVAVVVVAGTQASALAGLGATVRGAVLAGALVCVSRCALALTCRVGVPAARQDGLGVVTAGTVPLAGAAGSWGLAAVLVGGVAHWGSGDLGHALVAVVAAAVVVLLVVRVSVRRLGGVTGDVYGASIELALATLLLVVR